LSHLTLYTDGASRGNPGHASYGFVIFKNDKEIKTGKKYLGTATNNQAEYSAVLDGIKSALEIGCDELEVRMDSQLIARQLSGIYKIKDTELMKYFMKIKTLTFGKKIKYIHIPREQNKRADGLANEALDKKN
jgi:ribonuclease HI